MNKLLSGLVAAAVVATGSTAALAEDPPAFAWSFNIGATTDYVFRGVSQTSEDPAIFGGADVTYGMFYAGVWASGLDFGDVPGTSRNVASLEVDVYGGIKPVIGPVTFDLGVIGYIYPSARDAAAEFDYVEIKGGASGAIIPMLPKLTLGGVVYYSPEYTARQGQVITAEATAGYELPGIWKFAPTVSGLVGASYGDVGDGFIAANGKDEYFYWNVGLTLAVEKFSFDFRYHDTDISNTNGFCTGSVFQCDERFVFTGKFTY